MTDFDKKPERKKAAPSPRALVVLAVSALALLLTVATVLFSLFSPSFRGEAFFPTPAPVERAEPPSDTPFPLESAEPSGSALPSVSPAEESTADPASFVRTTVLIDGSGFAVLASRQAAEELVSAAVQHFEFLCPVAGGISEIQNTIAYEPADESAEVTSFDEAFKLLTDPTTPLRVRTVFTRSDVEAIKRETSLEPSDAHYVGTRFVSSYGRDGKKLKLNEYTYTNGVLVATRILEESTLSEPVNELVLIGARPIPEGAEPASDFGYDECAETELAFTFPVEGEVTRRFGFYDGVFHRGIDLGCAEDAPVKAPADGVVSAVLMRGELALSVEITHAGGFRTRLSLLHSASVSVGDSVSAGNTIGSAGASGLHFELLDAISPRNPLFYLNRG